MNICQSTPTKQCSAWPRRSIYFLPSASRKNVTRKRLTHKRALGRTEKLLIFRLDCSVGSDAVLFCKMGNTNGYPQSEWVVPLAVALKLSRN